jgi:hypothetical protein
MQPTLGNTLDRSQVAAILARHPANANWPFAQLSAHWIASDSFTLREIPVGAVGIATECLPPGGSITTGPIIVDANLRNIGVGAHGRTPEILVLDGKHRLVEAIRRGGGRLPAYVGAQVAALMDTFIEQERERTRDIGLWVERYLNLRSESPGSCRLHLKLLTTFREMELIEAARERVKAGEPLRTVFDSLRCITWQTMPRQYSYEEIAITWQCPKCHATNQDYYEQTVRPLCGTCDQSFQWDEVLSHAELDAANAKMAASECLV